MDGRALNSVVKHRPGGLSHLEFISFSLDDKNTLLQLQSAPDYFHSPGTFWPDGINGNMLI